MNQMLVWIICVQSCLCIEISFARSPETSFALLVGCTEYPNCPRLRELYGPVNDVPMWASLLTDPNGFAFPKENVTQLVGWPKEDANRPTYSNIIKGFEELVAKAKQDSRIVIVLSGHGIQVPVPSSQKNLLDPKNPEPDGLDEVFLPADVTAWTDDRLPNGLADNQIATYLERVRAKGAHILIVFDCCHSGTMTRGAADVREISRVADPAALKIPGAAYEQAATRAKKAIAIDQPIPAERNVERADRGNFW